MAEELPRLEYGGQMLRPSQSGYSTQDPYAAEVTNIPGGFSRITTDHLNGVYRVRATYKLDATQYLWWGAFYHTALLEGSIPFVAELALDTPFIQEYTCQIIGAPSKPRNLGFYTEVTLQMEAEPIIDPEYNAGVIEIIGELYGDDTAQILNYFNLLSNVWATESLQLR